MMEELNACAEEAFFERYFDYEDDNETALNNLESALNVYFRSHKECTVHAEMICDGEVVDVPTVTLSLQNMIFAYKYAEQFRKSLGCDGPVIDFASLDLSMSTEELAREGTKLVSLAKSTLDIPKLEKGKYLLFAANS